MTVGTLIDELTDIRIDDVNWVSTEGTRNRNASVIVDICIIKYVCRTNTGVEVLKTRSVKTYVETGWLIR